MKYLLILAIILLSINIVSAAKIGISPTEVYFNGSINEKICRVISISTDFNGYVLGSDRWTKSILLNKRDITQYNKNSEELGLDFEYEKEILIYSNEKKQTEICLNAKNPGKYNGALVYNVEGSIAGVGIWISSDIYDYENFGNKKQSYSIPIIITILLFIILIILILKIKNKEKMKRY